MRTWLNPQPTVLSALLVLICLSHLAPSRATTLVPSFGPIIRKTDTQVPDTGRPPAFEGKAWTGTNDADGPVAKCPQGSFVSGIQAFRDRLGAPGHNVADIQDLRYTCRSTRDGSC